MLLGFGPRGGGVWVGGGEQLRVGPGEEGGNADSPYPTPLHPLCGRPCSPSEMLHARAHFIIIIGGGGRAIWAGSSFCLANGPCVLLLVWSPHLRPWGRTNTRCAPKEKALREAARREASQPILLFGEAAQAGPGGGVGWVQLG